MKQTAIIAGSNGQDGRLIYENLLKRNYNILGIDRNIIKCTGLSWNNKIDISNTEEVFNLVKTIKPDRIFYLAAYHQSSEDKTLDDLELHKKSYKVNVFSFLNFLEAIRSFSSLSRIFYAASSHIFGSSPLKTVQNEETPFNPESIYGITKLNGLLLCRYYRNKYNIFASAGILYNHESPFRNENFVSKKIIKGAINIKNKKQDKLILGDLNAEIDWGYAPDYVEAMYRILSVNKPDDFIIATGEKHKVLDFVKITFDYLALDWRLYVEEDKNILTKKKIALAGDPEKLIAMTGWKPTVNFRQMIKTLLISDGVNINE